MSFLFGKGKCIRGFFVSFVFVIVSAIAAMDSFAAGEHSEHQSATPEVGGRILLGALADPVNLIPYLSTDAGSHDVSDLLYVSLLEYDKDLNIVPLAAKSYEVLNNGQHLKFVLHDNIYWEDGKQLTTDDIEFTYKLMIDPKTPTAYAEDFLSIKEFKKTGPLTFEVYYEKPFARALMTWMGAILPKHALEGQDIATTSFARKPIGAGPYKLKRWDSGSRIILEASDTYFKGRPYLNEAVFIVIPDSATMFLELRGGKLDMMRLSAQQYLKQTVGKVWEKNWNKYKYLSFSYTFLGFNLNHEFFKDKLTRQGVSHAINRSAIVESVLLGQGVAAFGPYKPETWAYNDTIQPVKYDPEEARALLHKAGWKAPQPGGILEKNGVPFKFTLLVNQGSEQRIRVANIIQQQLKDVGIDMQIRIVEWAAFLKEFVDKGRFDAVILAWTIPQDPDLYDVWHSSKAYEGGLNFIGYKNAVVDQLLVDARSELDQEVRKKLYYKVQEILHEDQPYCFLYVPYSLPIVKSKFYGIKPAPAGIMYNFDRWWIPKKLQ